MSPLTGFNISDNLICYKYNTPNGVDEKIFIIFKLKIKTIWTIFYNKYTS